MRASVVCIAIAVAVTTGCDRGPLADRARRQQSLGNLPADVRPAPEPPPQFGIGRVASDSEVAAWDVDVSPDGVGLPQGSGTPGQGAAVYGAKCASCHGAGGEGTPVAPKIIGRAVRDSFAFGRDPTMVKTVGNYWPYSTTLFDYVRRTMPISSPGSLTNSEVYAVVAFLLAENGIIDGTAVIDSLTLPMVRMPARDRFVPDDRKGGPVFR